MEQIDLRQHLMTVLPIAHPWQPLSIRDFPFSGLVHGIWFYDREDCSRISKLIERLSHEIARSKSNKVEANSRRNDAVQASETETNRRVMDFFARAGGKAPFSRPPPVPMAAINMNEVEYRRRLEIWR